MSKLTCAEFEILLADSLDGTLGSEDMSAVDAHRSGCASCAELAQDAAGAVAFMERAAVVEPPPALASRIVRSSGSAVLDQETLALLARAQPMPKPPGAMDDRQLSFVAPVRYYIR